MVRIAGCISKGIPGFLLDLYLVTCKTYASEVSMTSASGKARPGREHMDKLLRMSLWSSICSLPGLDG